MIDAIKNVASLSMTRGLSGVGSASATTEVLTPGLTTALGAADAAGTDSFASVMSNMASEAVGNLRQAEKASFDGIKGKLGTREVVDAVMQADQSLQTVMAVRDKLVSAFLDITKMQI